MLVRLGSFEQLAPTETLERTPLLLLLSRNASKSRFSASVVGTSIRRAEEYLIPEYAQMVNSLLEESGDIWLRWSAWVDRWTLSVTSDPRIGRNRPECYRDRMG